MSRGRPGHSDNPGHSNTDRTSSNQQNNVVLNIPNPLPITYEERISDKERYAEEKDNRLQQLEVSKRLNKITIVAAAAGVASVLGLIFSIYQSKQVSKLEERAWVGPYAICTGSPNAKPPSSYGAGCPEIPSGDIPDHVRVYFNNSG